MLDDYISQNEKGELMTKKKFSFIDLFAGIGGFRIGLENVGGHCVASSEIESKAIQTYRHNWPDDGAVHNLGDLTCLDQLPEHDLLVGGVPCQPWSIAGKNKGYSDSRGQLWYNVIHLIKKSQPKAFILENVKGLVDPRHSQQLSYIVNNLQSANYNVAYKLLNSFDYGVPQNRDRVFIVGISKRYIRNKQFCWPSYANEHRRLYEIFKKIERPHYQQEPFSIQRDMFGERVDTSFNKLTPRNEKNSFFILTDIRNGPTCVHSWDFKETTKREKDICMVILKNRRNPKYGACDGNPMSFEDISSLVPDLKEDELKGLVKKEILKQYENDKRYEFKNRRLSGGIDGVYRIFLPNSVFFPTITATGTKDVIALESVTGDTNSEYKSNFIKKILIQKKYRPITDKEALAIQGFPDNYKIIHSDVINKRLLGNSVAVPVISRLGEELIKTGVFG